MRLISRTTQGKSSSRMTSFGGYQKCSTSRNIRFNFRTICLDSVHFCVIGRLVNLNFCMYIRLVPGPEVLTDIGIRTASKAVEFYKQDGEIFEYTWSSSPPPLSSYSHPRPLYYSHLGNQLFDLFLPCLHLRRRCRFTHCACRSMRATEPGITSLRQGVTSPLRGVPRHGISGKVWKGRVWDVRRCGV